MPGTRADPAAELRALAPAAALLTSDISRLDAAATKLRLSIGGRDVTDSYRFRVLFDERTFATYLVYWGDATTDLLHVAATLSMGGTPVVHDLLRGNRVAASNFTRDDVTGSVQLQVPLTGGPMVLDFNEGATEIFADRSDVSAARALSVAEIIARHQEQQRAQDFAVRNYSADARMEQHFRATMADSGYDVVTENRYYVSGADIEWEELSFSVNGAKWGADRPPFPLLQAEKVLSLPLQLRFGADYRYELRGTDVVDEFDCYVIDFEPVAQRHRALSRDRVDRSRDLRAGARADGAERASGAGGVERRDAALHAGRQHRRAARVSVHQDVGTADSDGRRPECSRGKERGVHERSGEPAGLRRGS